VPGPMGWTRRELIFAEQIAGSALHPAMPA
jgi:hypothetical protein